jgi:hypothetical protein
MRRILPIILFLALSVLSVSAQTIQDAGYRIVGHIKSDGTIQDSGYKITGHIKSDGTIQDASYRIIGHIKSDGTVQDASYRIVGHIKSDGTVQDSSYRIIGHVKSDGTVQDASYRIIGHDKRHPDEMGCLVFLFPLIINTFRYEKTPVCRLRPLGVGLYPEDFRDLARRADCRAV